MGGRIKNYNYFPLICSAILIRPNLSIDSQSERFEKAIKHYNYKRPHRSLTTTEGKLRTPHQAFLDKMRK